MKTQNADAASDTAQPAASHTPESGFIQKGWGFNVQQDFARATRDLPVTLARKEYAKPGCVIGYIDADPNASLGFLKYGDRNSKVRVHFQERAFKAGGAA